MSLRVLVCGSRYWNDNRIVNALLTGLYVEDEPGHLCAEMMEFTVIEGGAPGADAAACWWAESSPMHSHNENPDDPEFVHIHMPADWERYGKAAGPIRNQQMLVEGKPDIVLAFKDGFGARYNGGTEHMVRIAKAAGVPTYVISRA